jgi:hypothetical protein
MNNPSSSQAPEDEPPIPREKHPGWSLVRIGIGVAIGMTVLWAISPRTSLCGKRASYRTEAINNTKQIWLALQEFDSTYGRFPAASTAARVKVDTNTPLTLGAENSNQLFRQLIATGLKSEKPFYAKTKNSRKPDDLFMDDAHGLSHGECAFAYVAGLSSQSLPSLPLAMTPMIPGTTRFDPGPFDGKAIVLRVDGSVNSLKIDPAGHVMVEGGKDLFDPDNAFWNGKVPDIKWPE